MYSSGDILWDNDREGEKELLLVTIFVGDIDRILSDIHKQPSKIRVCWPLHKNVVKLNV